MSADLTDRDGRVTVAPLQSLTMLEAGAPVGRYRIVARLGAGGMGEVYRAFDPQLDRTVAIKVLRNDAVLPRGGSLLAEAQAMARLSHPNVVAVYEVGTAEQQIFIAMEFIDGPTLAAWSSARPRSWREVVAVFAAAARGLDAAHRAGIIHRDFKPDNVFIDGEGRVRVGDFGLATRRRADPRDDRGGEVAGTPAYMSPEQLRGEVVDARSDQFSFCVALYEALFGVRPRAGRAIAELRKDVPAWLRRTVERGLAPAREDRHPTMARVAEALEHDPWAHRRPALLAVALAAATGLVVHASSRRPAAEPARCDPARAAAELAGAWDPDLRAQVRRAFLATGRSYAEETFARTAGALDRHAAAWAAMRHEVCDARIHQRQSPALTDLRGQCLDQRRSALRELTRLFAEKPDPDVLDKATAAAQGLGDLSRCADAATLLGAAPPPGDAATRARVEGLRGRLDRVEALEAAGRWREGLELGTLLVTEARAIGYPPTLAQALYLAGNAAHNAGGAAQAEALLRETLEAAGRAKEDRLAAMAWTMLVFVVGVDEARGADASSLVAGARAALARAGDPPILTARLGNAVGAALEAQGRFAESEAEYRKALAIFEHEEPDSLDVAITLNGLAIDLREQRHGEEARVTLERQIAISERVLGPGHPDVAVGLMSLGTTLSLAGDFDGAEQAYQRTIVSWERSLGADHPRVGLVLTNLAALNLDRERPDAALPAARRGAEIFERVYGSDNRNTASALDNLGAALFQLGRYEEARAIHQRTAATLEKALGPDHPRVAEPLRNEARALLALGRPVAARPFAARSRDIVEKTRGKESIEEGIELALAGELALAEGHASEAAQAEARSIALLERELGAGSMRLADPLCTLGKALLARRLLPEAIEALERAALLRARGRAGMRLRGDVDFALARALWEEGRDRARALTLGRQARDEDSAAGLPGHTELARVERWIEARRP